MRKVLDPRRQLHTLELDTQRLEQLYEDLKGTINMAEVRALGRGYDPLHTTETS